MKIDMHDKEDVKVVKVEGKLDTNTTPEAEARLGEIVEEGANKILIDFKDLDFVSSAGLRILLLMAKKLGSRGGALRYAVSMRPCRTSLTSPDSARSCACSTTSRTPLWISSAQ